MTGGDATEGDDEADSKLRVGTFFGRVELATLGDLDDLARLVARPFRYIFNLFDNIIALQDFSKNHMLAVEPAIQYSELADCQELERTSYFVTTVVMKN